MKKGYQWDSMKRCQVCGKMLGTMESMGYYSFIRTKYCKDCAGYMKSLQNAASARKAYKNKKERRNLYEEEMQRLYERVELLTEENEALRELTVRLREEL